MTAHDDAAFRNTVESLARVGYGWEDIVVMMNVPRELWAEVRFVVLNSEVRAGQRGAAIGGGRDVLAAPADQMKETRT